jgi:hypothetical protein
MALFNSRTGENTQETDALLNNEQMFYKELAAIFNKYKTGILHNMLKCQKPVIEIKQEKAIDNLKKEGQMVRFLEAVPSFVGENMEVFGPFESEDVANLPKKICEILIKNKRAEEI